MNDTAMKKKLYSDSSSMERDDLQQIKGIGQSIALALNNLGIYRFADMIHYTPDKLADALRPLVAFISSRRIERDNWLGQARALAETSKELDEYTSKVPGEGEEKAHRNASPDGWREVADFFVSFGYARDRRGKEQFQTKAHHSQADTLERWEGIAVEQVVDWMIRQANLPQAEASSEMSNEEEGSLSISELWVSEVVPSPGRRLSTPAMLRAEYRLHLSGQALVDLCRAQNPFSVELYLVNAENNHSDLIDTYSAQLMPDQLVYDLERSFPIPEAGRYQLYVVARLLPPGSAMTHLQGPVIQIEP